MATAPVPVSFEVYPPRRPEQAVHAWGAIRALADGGPEFMSVTYGASGSSRAGSRQLLQRLVRETDARAVAHVTCVGATRQELRDLVHAMLADGVRGFIALRGDAPAGQERWSPPPGGLTGASELVALIREVAATAGLPDDAVTVAVAAHPPVPTRSLAVDLEALLAKQQAGADAAITQIFFDVESYLALVAAARGVAVTLPVVPGLVPLTSPDRLAHLSALTGVPVPGWVQDMLAVTDPAERVRRGTAATVRLAGDVLQAGAPGVHVYTFNQPGPALDILHRVRAAPTAGATLLDLPERT